MNEKTIAIENYLLTEMPERLIQYRYADFLHKFRIEGDLTHWIYISKELVDDSAPAILVNLININGLVNTLNAATSSKWLFLSADGVREVDAHFATNERA